MIRRSFLRRMALAAAACAFIDVPWPKVHGGPPVAWIREKGYPTLGAALEAAEAGDEVYFVTSRSEGVITEIDHAAHRLTINFVGRRA